MWQCFYIVLSPCAILLKQNVFGLNLIFFHNLFVAANALHATNNFQIIPDFSLKDSLDQTVLGLALWTGKECCICTLLILDNIYCMILICFVMSIMFNVSLPGMHTIAAQLLGSGASINDTMSNGQTLLHMAIQRQDSKSALFLLEHQADINVR